jgi:hypothetical protein
MPTAFKNGKRSGDGRAASYEGAGEFQLDLNSSGDELCSFRTWGVKEARSTGYDRAPLNAYWRVQCCWLPFPAVIREYLESHQRIYIESAGNAFN